MTHREVLEADEMVEGVRIRTYLVYYDLEKDFTLPRKAKSRKK